MATALHNTVKFLSGLHNIVTEDMNLKLSSETLIDQYYSLPTVESNLVYPVKEVPVALFESGPIRYGVSVNVLSLFMEMNQLTDLDQAIHMIAEANDLRDRDLAIVMPPVSVIRQQIQEAKDDTEPSSAKAKVSHLQRTGSMVQEIKNKGIPICKEPGVMDVKWNAKTNIVNIEKPSSYLNGIDYDSLRNY